MNCVKKCLEILNDHGIDGKKKPYLDVIKFFCTGGFSAEEIAANVRAAILMPLLLNRLADGTTLSADEHAMAIRLLKDGKSLDEVLDALKKTNPSISINV